MDPFVADVRAVQALGGTGRCGGKHSNPIRKLRRLQRDCANGLPLYLCLGASATGFSDKPIHDLAVASLHDGSGAEHQGWPLRREEGMPMRPGPSEPPDTLHRDRWHSPVRSPSMFLPNRDRCRPAFLPACRVSMSLQCMHRTQNTASVPRGCVVLFWLLTHLGNDCAHDLFPLSGIDEWLRDRSRYNLGSNFISHTYERNLSRGCSCYAGQNVRESPRTVLR